MYTISNLLFVITCLNFPIFFVYYIHYNLKGFHMFLVQHPTSTISSSTHQILFICWQLKWNKKMLSILHTEFHKINITPFIKSICITNIFFKLWLLLILAQDVTKKLRVVGIIYYIHSTTLSCMYVISHICINICKTTYFCFRNLDGLCFCPICNGK